MWVLPLCLLAALLWLLARAARVRRLQGPFWCAFALTAVVGWIRITCGISGPDAALYDSLAEQFATGDFRGFGSQLPTSKSLPVILLGILYALAGQALPMLGILTNALLVASTALLVGKATRNLTIDRLPDSSTALTAAWVVALSPPIVYWASDISREPLTYLALALALLGASHLREYPAGLSRALLLASLSIAILALTRQQLLIVVFVLMITALLALAGKRGIGTGLVLATLSTAFAASIYLLRGQALNVLDPESRAVVVALNRSVPEAQFGSGALIVPEGGQDPVLAILLAQFGPLPGTWSSPELMLAGLDGLWYAGVAALLLVGALSCLPRNWGMPMMLGVSMLPVLIGNAWLLANFGLAARIRSVNLILAAPLVAIGIEVLLRRGCCGRKAVHSSEPRTALG